MSCINAALVATASLLSPDCWQEQASNKIYQQAIERFQPQLAGDLKQITDKLADQQLPSTNIDNTAIFGLRWCGFIIPRSEVEPNTPSFHSLSFTTTTYRYRPLDHMIQYFQNWPEYRIVAYLE